MNVSKNHVVCARCHLAGLASAHDCTIMSSEVSGAQISSLRRRTLQNCCAKEVAMAGVASELIGILAPSLHLESIYGSVLPARLTLAQTEQKFVSVFLSCLVRMKHPGQGKSRCCRQPANRNRLQSAAPYARSCKSPFHCAKGRQR